VKADVKKNRFPKDQDTAVGLLLASAPARLLHAQAASQNLSQKSLTAPGFLPRGSDEINKKNETYNNKPTYAKKDIH
jgi:hypothetical protein